MQVHSYIELTLTFSTSESFEEWSAVATYFLAEIGFDTFTEEEPQKELHAYIQKSAYNESATKEALAPVSEYLSDYQICEIADQDWNEEWEKNYYKPVEVVPGRVLIRASFHEVPNKLPYEIVIDPKMAFGTGHHATTAGMLRLIDTLDLMGKEVIDMGCGSGVLGIFALMKGASHCLSIDIDPRAVENAEANAHLNEVHPIEILEGDAHTLVQAKPADLFLANIIRSVILQDLDIYLSKLKVGGTLLLSGFLQSDLPVIERALRDRNMHILNVVNPEGDWVALKARSLSDLNIEQN